METCCRKSQQNVNGSFLYLWPLRFYRYVISPLMGPHCRFEPSCSHYAEQAFMQHGFLKGFVLSIKRLAKCHPWHPGGYDPVPSSSKTDLN